MKRYCFCCEEVGYTDDEFDECADCGEQFLVSCLSEEGEDGSLCVNCLNECSTCGTPIYKDVYESNHMDKCIECYSVACPYDKQMEKCIYCKKIVCIKHVSAHTCK